jgi:hypothetical protein
MAFQGLLFQGKVPDLLFLEFFLGLGDLLPGDEKIGNHRPKKDAYKKHLNK